MIAAVLAGTASCVDVDYFAVSPDKRPVMETCYVAYPVHLDYMKQHGTLLGKISTQRHGSDHDESLDAAREECASHGGTHLVLTDRAQHYQGTIVQTNNQTTGDVSRTSKGFAYQENLTTQTSVTPIYAEVEYWLVYRMPRSEQQVRARE